MSAPDTNVEKQKKRHAPAMSAIKLSLAVVAILFVGWLAWVAWAADAPEEVDVQVQSGADTVQTD
ncbi:hypothetical protein ACN2XU_08090 [Primorskyibacter sp. 2E107]|uniref:hypothetical protein n=1 Tax=Primorskyibacter sp. 2E107 TaxID=3403458 RepID=UPI003AF991DE